GSSEHLAVVFELRNKDVLHLKVPSRVQKRHCVQETLQRTGAEVESLVQDSFSDEILQQRRLHARRQRSIEDALDRHEPLFQANRVPDRSPESHAVLDVSLKQMRGTNFEESVYRSSEFRRTDPNGLAYTSSRCCGHVSSGLDEIQLPIADDDLV